MNHTNGNICMSGGNIRIMFLPLCCDWVYNGCYINLEEMKKTRKLKCSLMYIYKKKIYVHNETKLQIL